MAEHQVSNAEKSPQEDNIEGETHSNCLGWKTFWSKYC